MWFSTAPPDKQQPLTIIMKAMTVSFHNYSFTPHIPRYMTSAVITWPKNNRITIQLTNNCSALKSGALSFTLQGKKPPSGILDNLCTVNGLFKSYTGRPYIRFPSPTSICNNFPHLRQAELYTEASYSHPACAILASLPNTSESSG